MAMTSGTATNFLDLFEKLRAFILDGVTGAGWLPVLGADPQTDSIGIRNLRSDQADKWEVFDCNVTTFVRFPYNGGYIAAQFFEAKTIGSIKLTSPAQTGGGLNTYSAKDVYLHTSVDGQTWTVAKTWTNLAQWTDRETRTLTLDAPVTTSWVRIMFPVSYNNNADIAQLQFFDDLGARIMVNLGNVNAGRVLVKSPFSASGVSAHVHVSMYCRPDDNMFQLGFGGASNFFMVTDPYLGFPYASSDNSVPFTAYAYCWDSPMPYWFYGNERFVYGFVKVGSTYRQFGFGYLLPYATPQQYLLPMFVGAENNSANTWDNDDDNNIRGFTNPAGNSLNVFTPSNTWVSPRNYNHAGGDAFSPTEDRLWPSCVNNHRSTVNAPGTDGTNGNYALYPLIAMNYNDHVYGEMPNIYSVPNLSLASEDTITIGGDTYKVFQNIWRTSRWDYCAVKEE